MKLYRYDYANAYTGAESKEEAIEKFQVGGYFNGFLANDGNVHEVEAQGFTITVSEDEPSTVVDEPAAPRRGRRAAS